jgi:lysophospholipase L1-like esterase
MQVLALLSLQLLVALLCAHLCAALTNTLAHNGNWVATKATLARRVMGSLQYVTTSQTLAGGHLDLGRWHGRQEVLYREPLAPAEVSFDFRLGEDAYLIFVFNKTDAGFSGLRLSRNERFDSLYFAARGDGEFVSTQPVGAPELGGGWMRVRAFFERERVVFLLDERPLGSFAVALAPRQTVGFRNGRRSVWIDDVRIRRADSPVEIRESFFNARAFLAALVVVGLVLVIADAVVARTARRRRLPPRTRFFARLTLVLTLLACLLVVAVAQRSFLSRAYPAAHEELEEEFKAHEIEQLRREIRERYREEPAAGTIRVLIVGTSQTWGAGAAREEDAFPSVLERRLNAASPGGRRFECINAGVSALDASRLLELYAADWVHLSPHLVVLNLSSNDWDPRRFAGSLERFVQINRARGIRTLFALEPNSFEHRPGRLPLHSTMRDVALRWRVPVVDVHDALKRAIGRGLLWWDFVHPTSFGHRVIAETLEPEVERLTTDLP